MKERQTKRLIENKVDAEWKGNERGCVPGSIFFGNPKEHHESFDEYGKEKCQNCGIEEKERGAPGLASKKSKTEISGGLKAEVPQDSIQKGELFYEVEVYSDSE